MATTSFLEKAYLAYFGRPLDSTAVTAYGNTTEAVVMTAFSSSSESKALYGPTFGLTQINAIYNMLFGRNAEDAGAKLYLDHVTSGRLTPADVAMAILNGARNEDKIAVDNKIIASHAFTLALDTPAEAAGYAGDIAAASARAFLGTVTATAASDAAITGAVFSAVSASSVVSAATHTLTLTEAFSAATVGKAAVLGPVMWGYNPHAHTEVTTTVDNTGAGTVNASGVVTTPANNAANLSNEGPIDGGIPVADLISFLTTITGLDLKELGLVDASGQQTFANVTSLSISNAVSSGAATAGGANTNTNAGNATTTPQLTIGYADGSSMNAEVALGDGYFKFLNDLLFDAQGNSRLYQNVITPATAGTNASLQAIKLNMTVNNGGTLEVGYTTAGDDTIVAGRLELLHGAYIDGGAGYNTLEIDAKGTYAQPAELLNIQEVRVNDLPNWYTTTSTIAGTSATTTLTGATVGGVTSSTSGGTTAQNTSTDLNGALTNGYLNNSSYPELSSVPHTNDSWLDLSRATSIKKLVVTDGGALTPALDGTAETSGSLTIVGIRNGALTRLEGSFNDTLTLQYGAGNTTGAMNLELALGDVTGTVNLLQNAAVLNIDSTGMVNHMHNFFAGGSVSRMYIKGTGEFAVDQNIAKSFNANAAVIIDATANTGGLNINFDGVSDTATLTQALTARTASTFASVTVKGTAVDDVIMVKNVVAATSDQTSVDNGALAIANGKVTIDAGNGSNTVVTDGSSIVKITTGTGDDTISAKDAILATIVAGDGNNVIIANHTVLGGVVSITSGLGDDNISAQNANNLTISAGDGNNLINANGSKTAVITTGAGNDTITVLPTVGTNNVLTDAGTVTITAGEGNNTINVRASTAISITTGAGNDKVTVSGAGSALVATDAAVILATDGAAILRSNTALINLDLGTGTNTVTLGHSANTATGQVTDSITALDGSTITGSNIKLVVNQSSDLIAASLTGVTSVVLNTNNTAAAANGTTLTLTSTQMAALNTAGTTFGVTSPSFQNHAFLNVVVTGSANFTDLVSAATLGGVLNGAVDLKFVVMHGATLTLTAEQLDKYVAPGGITVDGSGLNGKVIINGASATFVPWLAETGTTYGLNGGSLTAATSTAGVPAKDVTINRVTIGGYDRAVEAASTDTITIDSTGTAALTVATAVVIDKAGEKLVITGNQNVVFASGVTIDARAGGLTQTHVSAETAKVSIDFSKLVGTVTNMSVLDFDNVKSVAGNGNGTRIDVQMHGDVGLTGETNGLISTGVSQYVVTSVTAASAPTFFMCDATQDVTTIGLHGNGDKAVTFAQVPWGKVSPTILLEGDGYANANEALKVDGSPNTSDVGAVTVSYFVAGAPAVVQINNGGVELGVTATGAERKFTTGTLTLTNAASASITVAQGDVTMAGIAGSALTSVKFVATEDVTVTAALPSLLKSVDASGVVGAFKVSLVDPVDHAIVVTGGAGLMDLTLSSFSPSDLTETGSSIIGGTGLAKLTVSGVNDLSKMTLTNVDKVVVANSGSVTLTLAQVTDIVISDITTSGASATLNLAGLGGTAFSVGSLTTGMQIGTVTLAATPVITLDPATSLKGVSTLVVPDGTTLNLTAAQFQQLGAHTITGSGTAGSMGTVNITGLTQADINPLDLNGDGVYTGAGEHAGFSLAGVTGVKMGAITLAESVTLKATDSLGTFKTIVMGNSMTLAVGEIQQANGLKISGGTNTVLQINDTNLGLFGATANLTAATIEAKGLNVTTVKLLNVLVAGQNVDAILDHLPGSVVKEIYNDLAWVSMINQAVTIDAGTTVSGNLTFSPITNDTELQSFTLNLSGGTEITGNLNLATTAKVVSNTNQMRTHLDTLTINSTGTAVNLLSGKTANTITLDITPMGAASQADTAVVAVGSATNNNLLKVVINATQALVVKGDVVFSSVVFDDTYTGNDNAAAIATLTVTGTANVSLGTVNTLDTDVDGLTVSNTGTGTLSLTLDAGKIDQVTTAGTLYNNDALSFTGGNIALTIKGAVNLSDDVTSGLSKITLGTTTASAELTLTAAQLTALGAANLVDDGVAYATTAADLNIVGFDSASLFNATTLASGINVKSITLAAGTTTLDASVNLTGVDKIIIQEGSTLNLTAAQFQQLQGKGAIQGVDGADTGSVIGTFTVNITGLTQADVLKDDTLTDTVTGTQGFDLTGIVGGTTTDAPKVNITLADSSVDLGKFVSGLAVPAFSSKLGAVASQLVKFDLAAGQSLGLVNSTQANNLQVAGGANSTLALKFATLDSGTQINAAGYTVTTLKALATFVAATDVEAKLLNVPSSVIELYYADALSLGFVNATNRIAVVDAGVNVNGFLMYNDLQTTQEVRSLDLTLSGGSKITGDVDLSTTAKVNTPTLVQQYLDSVTIHSVGTSANTITGNVTAVDPDGAGNKIENNLTKVTIDASQPLVVGLYDSTGAYTSGGNIVFSSLVDSASASLTITGTAAVTVHGLDATDNTNDTISGTLVNEGDIGTLTITNNSSGLFTATGGTAAITGPIENLVLKGTGAMAFGTNAPGGVVNAEGLTSATISSIDASGLTGALSLGIVNDVDSAAFAFKAGSGLTSLTFKDAVLNASGTDAIMGTADDTAGWSFDFTNAAAGSTFHMNAGYTVADIGAINIKLGANTTLYIDENTDWTKADLSILGTAAHSIVLKDGVTLTLTAAQANALHIVAGADIITGGLVAGITAKVNIIDLSTAAVDFSGIATNIAGTVTLKQSDTVTHAADVTLDVATNLGEFTVVLQSLSLNDFNLSGQTVRYTTVAQADNAVSVIGSGVDDATTIPVDLVTTAAVIADTGANSSNVVWLFNTMTAPIDTSKYDANLGRLMYNAALVNSFGGLVENMFSTLPGTGTGSLSSTILRVDFASVTALNILLTSATVDRTMEFSSFTNTGNLTFSDIGIAPVEHLHSLTLVLGGQAIVGNVLIDDVIPAAGYNPLGADQFSTLTVDSHLALTGRTAASAALVGGNTNPNYLASESYVNNNNGASDPSATPGVSLESVQPTNINTVGNIGVGAVNGLDLTAVVLKTNGVSVGGALGVGTAGDGANLNVGTITYGYVPTTIAPTTTATLTVSGANNVNVISVNTSDADITGLTVTTTGFTGTLTAPGASPALKLDNTQTLTFVNDITVTGTADNAQNITLGSGTAGTLTANAGIAGNELSFITATGFDGTLNLGILAQLDSTNDDSTPLTAANDGLQAAFSMSVGTGITTATLAAANSLTPTLAAGSEWKFNYTGAAAGSYLKITPSVVFTSGSTLTLTAVPVVIEGAVNLSQLVDNVATATVSEGLSVTGGSFEVLAGATLTLTAKQVASGGALAGVTFFGAGTVVLTGDASNLTALGTNIHTAAVDISALTLIASPTTGFDTTTAVELGLSGAWLVIATVQVVSAQTVTGSANKDDITQSGTGADNLNGGLLNDTLSGGAGNDTYNVTSGTDTINTLATGDILVVSAGAFAVADVLSGFTATAATTNAGTVTLTGGASDSTTIDMHLAGGASGYVLIGGSSATAGNDILIGSNQADVINGGGTLQTSASAVDTLTGNGGADVFQFNVSTSTPVAFTASTTTSNVDKETLQFNTGATASGSFTVNYTVNGGAVSNRSVAVLSGDTAIQVATKVVAAFAGVTGFTATSGTTDTVTLNGPSGSGLTITGITASGTGLTTTVTTGTDIAQIDHVAVGTAGVDVVTAGEKFTLAYTLADGTTTVSHTYTANVGDGLTDAAVVNGLIALFTEGYVTLASATVLGVAGINITDAVADNGGFTTTLTVAGAFNGSGASANGAPTIATADVITDFLSLTDVISFVGLVDGTAVNYVEAAQVATYSAATLAAGSALLASAGVLEYYMTSVAAAGPDAAYGVVFFDANHDGAVDGVVKLVGVDAAHFAFSDIKG